RFIALTRRYRSGPPFHDTPTSENYTLSLHDALPISLIQVPVSVHDREGRPVNNLSREQFQVFEDKVPQQIKLFVHEDVPISLGRSEEHTSELQSHLNLVCRLLLEKKNNAPENLNCALTWVAPHREYYPPRPGENVKGDVGPNDPNQHGAGVDARGVAPMATRGVRT